MRAQICTRAPAFVLFSSSVLQKTLHPFLLKRQRAAAAWSCRSAPDAAAPESHSALNMESTVDDAAAKTAMGLAVWAPEFASKSRAIMAAVFFASLRHPIKERAW
mgnify:CR=1 FL=1